MSRICGIKRPRGQRTCQMQPNSGMGRLQQDYRQSQYSQYPGGDRYSPYPSMYNNNDNNPEPIETTSTSSSWKQERPTLAPDYPEPNEQTETNVGFSDYHQDGLQPTQQPCIGYIPQSQLSWVEDTQHRSTASNTVETEPDWDWPARTGYARDPITSAEYNISHPNPCPLPLNQPATDFNFQGRENDPEISRLAGSTTAYCPPSNVSFPYVLSGLSPPALAAQGSEYLDTNNLGSLMSEIVDGIETNADQEPWSVYERNQSTQLTPQDYSNLGTYRNGTPNTNPSTFDYGDSESSYPTGDDSWTHISSNYPNNDSMNHSILTERPETFNFQESSAILPYPSFFAQIPVRPRVLLRGATPPVGPQDNAIDTSIRETGSDGLSQNLLSPVVEHSDTASCSSGASSPAGPSEIFCNADGCVAIFSGMYRKGNLARHKRLKHKGPVVYECEDPSCDRVFQRQDARTKHYRRWHPQLASEYQPRHEARRANRERYSDQLSSKSG